jgi:MerR family transcriptional regulator, heat shock protein HspR
MNAVGDPERGRGVEAITVQHEVYFISMAARLLDMHPQTLRKYERLGLVRPSRTLGSMRLYSREELDRLRVIKHLVDDVGVNLAGVQMLLSIAESVQRLRPLLEEQSTGVSGRRRMAAELKRISEIVGL